MGGELSNETWVLPGACQVVAFDTECGEPDGLTAGSGARDVSVTFASLLHGRFLCS